jgi:hypothetical protein
VEPTSINDGTIWSDYVQNENTMYNYVNPSLAPGDGSTGFDGNLATRIDDWNGVYNVNNTYRLEFIPASAISYSSKVEVYTVAGPQHPYNNDFFIDTGSGYGSAINHVQNSWVTLASGSGSVSKIKSTATQNGTSWTAIKIDGTILIDGSGAIVVNGNAAATNFNPFTTDINAVRGQETGYCTWNPLSKANINLSDGNLTAIPGANDQSCFATLSIPDNGKVYFEFTCIQRGGGGAQSPIWGVGNPSGVTLALNPQNSGNNASTWLYGGDGNKTGGGSGSTSYGTAFIAGDIIGVCVDRSNSRIWFSKNNVWQNGGNPNNPTDSNAAFTNVTSTGTLIPFYGNNNSTYGYGSVNFGQKPFKFPPPAGFQPLNGANVRPETVITRPDHYVGVTTYTGNASTQSITGLPSPDFLWIKDRSDGNQHCLYDTVRGANKPLFSSNDVAEQTQTSGMSAFTSTGFNLNGVNSNSGATNQNNNLYVAWAWKAGGNKNTFNKDDVGYASAAAAGITEGTISLTGASIGTKQGFSIIKYTGNSAASASIGHGLTQAPKFIICKNIGITKDWVVYTETVGPGNTLYLNKTDQSGGGTGTWGNVSPTSTVFSVGSNSTTNYSGPMIAYCWHDVPGLQKFGSYEGNSTAPGGPFIELGFRPALLIVKNIDAGSSLWLIADKERNKFNPIDSYLQAQSSDNEYGPLNSDSAYTWVDFLSNGFKLKENGVSLNASNTYIYAAWAEAPTFNLFGGQSNAR